jgi:hypothetical protein
LRILAFGKKEYREFSIYHDKRSQFFPYDLGKSTDSRLVLVDHSLRIMAVHVNQLTSLMIDQNNSSGRRSEER